MEKQRGRAGAALSWLLVCSRPLLLPLLGEVVLALELHVLVA